MQEYILNKAKFTFKQTFTTEPYSTNTFNSYNDSVKTVAHASLMKI